MNRPSAARWRRSGAAAAAVLALTLASASHAAAEDLTRSGHLSVTPGWTTAVYNRNPLTLPFGITAPCETTDYGGGNVSTDCAPVNVDLVHPSSPASIDLAYVIPGDDGAGSGSLMIYGYMVKGYGPHVLRATDTRTGRTATATVTLKALTRVTAGAVGRTKRAPASSTLRVTGRLFVFDGFTWQTPSGAFTLTLQRLAGTTWRDVRTVSTSDGSASWSLKLKGKATYRVCHAADDRSTASCTSPRTL